MYTCHGVESLIQIIEHGNNIHRSTCSCNVSKRNNVTE